jgi:flagellar protein FliO/FliZ
MEATPIDSRRRAVILQVDGREALIVTGGPQDSFIGWL